MVLTHDVFGVDVTLYGKSMKVQYNHAQNSAFLLYYKGLSCFRYGVIRVLI
jgi:hypothetical protein